jgi:uncharacterized protein YqcC (DUF446 family)
VPSDRSTPTPHRSPASKRKSFTIITGCMLVCFALLVAIARWVGEMDWLKSLTYAGLLSLGVGIFLLVVRLADQFGGWVIDRVFVALGRSRRRARSVVRRFPPAEQARRLGVLAALLDEVEAELRRLGWWEAHPPPLRERVENGELKSYLDAPSFELWLQCVFLPNARSMVARDALPPSSSVGVMAMREYDYHSFVPEAHTLLRLLQRFDGELNALAGHDPLSG